MTPLFPHDKEEKRQLTAVWLYFLFGGDSALFNISAIMNRSASIELLCFKSPHKKHRQAAKRYFSNDIGHHLHKKEFYINPTDVVPSLKDLEDVFGEIKLPKL